LKEIAHETFVNASLPILELKGNVERRGYPIFCSLSFYFKLTE